MTGVARSGDSRTIPGGDRRRGTTSPDDGPRVHATPATTGVGTAGPTPSHPRLWECPEGCGAAARTVDHKIPHHPCPHHGGVMLPLVRSGTRAAYVPVARPDDVRGDLVQPVRERRRGRLLMAIDTVRDDGYDRSVLAPTARATLEDRDG